MNIACLKMLDGNNRDVYYFLTLILVLIEINTIGHRYVHNGNYLAMNSFESVSFHCPTTLKNFIAQGQSDW